MSDRPTPPRRVPSGPPLGGAYASAEDAVFEDLGGPGDGRAGSTPPTWETLAPEPAPAPRAPEPGPAGPAVQLGDPFGDGAAAPAELGYDPSDGFQIGFDDEPAQTTALAPIVPQMPATRPSGPPAVLPSAAPVSSAPRAEARRSFRSTLRMLRRHAWLIAGLTALGLAVGAAYATFRTPSYEAHSILLIIPNDTEAGAGGVAQAPGVDVSKVVNQGLVLQQAPQIAQSAAASILARPDADAFSTVQKATKRYGGALTPEGYGEYLQDKAVTVGPAADEADAIKVSAKAALPEEATLIAQLYTDAYVDLTRTSSQERSTRTREVLDEQIARREGELSEIENQLERFMTSENAAGLDDQTRMTVSSIGQLQGQLDLARVEAQTHRARLGQLRSDLASVPERLERSAQAPSVVETSDLDTQIASDERLLEQIYRQNPQLRGDPTAHPDVAEIDTRLRGLRADRQRRIASATDAAVGAGGLDMSSSTSNGRSYLADLQRQISTIEAELAGAEARARTLSGRLAEARGQLRAVPGQQVELGQLERQRTQAALTLDQLHAEYDRASLAETTELGFAQVLREVQVPRKPTGLKPPAATALGGIVGLLLGLGLAFIRFQTDSTARTPDDLREHGFTVIGTIPDLTDALRGGRHEIEGALVHPGLVTLSRPFSPEAEAFRHLHAGLYAGGGAHPQVVLVGAPESHAGTSLVAANLAAAAAQAGRRTLLIDADLRRPAVGALFGFGEQAPLGEGPADSNLVYWSTSVPGLLAMTPRETAASPDQMWAPHQVGALLQNLRSAFDIVIIDTPSALASADATLLAPHADAALLVAQSGRTDIEAMEQVASELASVGLTRVGAVLNRFDPTGAIGFRSTAGVRHAARD
ncbi:GumC family protein [Rubrivirga sp. IMCC43871]|uniref:GumC family protein n=1 Tax=Rubrivirga sp. IMCC43871 TaxID=3391575 RepID=UPI00398FDF7A